MAYPFRFDLRGPRPGSAYAGGVPTEIARRFQLREYQISQAQVNGREMCDLHLVPPFVMASERMAS